MIALGTVLAGLGALGCHLGLVLGRLGIVLGALGPLPGSPGPLLGVILASWGSLFGAFLASLFGALEKSSKP